MTAREWISAAGHGRLSPRLEARNAARRGQRRAARPGLERLESLKLMDASCPTISGHVFLDENPTNPALTNNGLLNTGEPAIPNAQVSLFNAAGLLVATTTTDPTGSYSFGGMSTSASPGVPMTITQTVTLGNVAQPSIPTNYTNLPFGPTLQLFNPSLGTLQAVQISSDVAYNSNVSISNLSRTTPATDVTAMLTGASYRIDGLGPETISGTPMKTATGPDLPPWNGKPGQEPTDTFNLSVEEKQQNQDPAAQALRDFFTAQPGRTTITPTMSATGGGTGGASNGNGRVTQSTFVGTSLTITYTYVPAAPCLLGPGTYKIVQTPTPPDVIDGKASENGVVFPNPGSPQVLQVTVNSTTDDLMNNDFGKLTAACPVPGPITRFGVHRQKTQLVLSFTGEVDPTLASDPKNYTIVATPTDHIPIASARFNPASNSVTLIPARRLNVHYHFTLSLRLPCPSGEIVNVPFGGKQSLGGFLSENHRRLIPVRNGHIVH